MTRLELLLLATHVRHGALELSRGRRTRKCALIRPDDVPPCIALVLSQQTIGKGGGLLACKPAVEEQQRLRRHRGDIAGTDGPCHVRAVETLEERKLKLPLEKHIHGSSCTLGGLRIFPVRSRRNGPPDDLTLEARKETTPAHTQVELAACGQHGVSHCLRLETLQVLTPEVRARGIEPRGTFPVTCGAAVGGRRDDLAMQALEPPAVFDELAGQPVQELRMAWRRPGAAEVARRRDNAAAEVMPPEAVDHHAGGQRVLLARHPLGEDASAPRRFPLLARRRQLDAMLAKDDRKGRGDLFGRTPGVAAQEHVSRRSHTAAFADRQDPIERRLLFEDLPSRLLQSFLGGSLLLAERGGELLARQGKYFFAAGRLEPCLLDTLARRGLESLELLLGFLPACLVVALPRVDGLRAVQGRQHGVLRTQLRLRVRPQVVEEGEHGVVVVLAQRLGLVIVAASTAHRQAKEGLGGGAHDVIEFLVALGAAVLVGAGVEDSKTVVTRRDERSRRHVVQLVAGELLENETIVRLRLVEALNDVVAVSRSERFLPVELVAVRLSVAYKVEPVASPALPVARACQEPVDHSLIGIRSGVVEKGVHVLGRGWQSGQIEGHAAQQRAIVGRWVRLEAHLLEARQHEGVDGIVGCGSARETRWGRAHERLKRPVLAVLVGDDQGRLVRFHSLLCRPGGALQHPSLERCDLVRGELVLVLLTYLLVALQDLDQDTRVRVARLHGRAGRAAVQQVPASVDTQLTLLTARAMTGVALLDEDRTDLLLEERLRFAPLRRGVLVGDGALFGDGAREEEQR